MGFILASTAVASGAWLRLAAAACVSLLMYSAGVIWNDLFDLAEDRRDRPCRPLPAGEIRPLTAAVVASVLAAASVAIATVIGRPTLYVTLALGLLVLAYNARAKRNAVLGPLTMGLCRGMSVLVGASAVGAAAAMVVPAVLVAAAGATIYIGAVTILAAGEARPTAVRAKAMMIFLAAGAWLTGLVICVQPATADARWAMTAMAALTVVWIARRLAALGAGEPAPSVVQRTIGGLIRSLILIQATAVVSTGRPGLYAAAVLIACFFISGLLARRFYAS